MLVYIMRAVIFLIHCIFEKHENLLHCCIAKESHAFRKDISIIVVVIIAFKI